MDLATVRMLRVSSALLATIFLGIVSCFFLFLTIDKVLSTSHVNAGPAATSPSMTRGIHLKRKLSEYVSKTGGDERSDIEKQLHEASIWYCIAPAEPRFNRPAEVKLFVEWKRRGSPTTNSCPNQITLNEDERISDSVLTTLGNFGADATIEPSGERKLVVLQNLPAHWTWEVTPKGSGSLVLRFEIFTLVKTRLEPEAEMVVDDFTLPPVHITRSTTDVVKELFEDIGPISTGIVSLFAAVGAIAPLLSIFRGRRRIERNAVHDL